jgi:hypothetical protein
MSKTNNIWLISQSEKELLFLKALRDFANIRGWNSHVIIDLFGSGKSNSHSRSCIPHLSIPRDWFDMLNSQIRCMMRLIDPIVLEGFDGSSQAHLPAPAGALHGSLIALQRLQSSWNSYQGAIKIAEQAFTAYNQALQNVDADPAVVQAYAVYQQEEQKAQLQVKPLYTLYQQALLDTVTSYDHVWLQRIEINKLVRAAYCVFSQKQTEVQKAVNQAYAVYNQTKQLLLQASSAAYYTAEYAEMQSWYEVKACLARFGGSFCFWMTHTTHREKFWELAPSRILHDSHAINSIDLPNSRYLLLLDNYDFFPGLSAPSFFYLKLVAFSPQGRHPELHYQQRFIRSLIVQKIQKIRHDRRHEHIRLLSLFSIYRTWNVGRHALPMVCWPDRQKQCIRHSDIGFDLISWIGRNRYRKRKALSWICQT